MCGRFSLTTPPDVIAELYGVEDVPDLGARYNVAPSQPIVAIRQIGAAREAEVFVWGLADRAGGLTINARSESVAQTPMFRDAFATRRCAVPADGYYEWQTIGRRRQPYLVRPTGGMPIALAGLWTPAKESPGPDRVVLLTGASRGDVERIHDRMPLLLPMDRVASWLGAATPHRELQRLIEDPFDALEPTPVSLAVNNASFDGPECYRPVPTLLS